MTLLMKVTDEGNIRQEEYKCSFEREGVGEHEVKKAVEVLNFEGILKNAP